MNIFLRTFNPDINSKTGSPLHPDAPRRGTPEWLKFQSILIDCLNNLGHRLHEQLENPLVPDTQDFYEEDGHCGENYCSCRVYPDKRIYVHKTKREYPNGDLFWMQMHMRELFTLDTHGWGADH